jgi:hypothetical protein
LQDGITSNLAGDDDVRCDSSLQDGITCDNTKALEAFLKETKRQYQPQQQSYHDDDVVPVKYDDKGNTTAHNTRRSKRQKYNFLYLYVIEHAVKVGVTSFKTFQDLIERHQTNLGKPIILVWFPVPYYEEPLFKREMFEEHFIKIVSENAIAMVALITILFCSSNYFWSALPMNCSNVLCGGTKKIHRLSCTPRLL